ncbi:MAG TPA: hypothetical protein VHE30_17030 [Polyangiaceae bacterium]|nr:hypothetical protein [Polyangiaceae bacterium]
MRKVLRSRKRPGFLVLALGLPALAIAGCQSIAGIEERHYDPQANGGGGAPATAQCTDYCNTVMEACTDTFAVYPSKEVCLGVCALLDPGDPAKAEGTNTVACRAKAAKNAALSGESGDYCPSAGPGGAGKCGEDCDSYCTLYAKVCPETASENCAAECPVLLDDGTFDAKKNHDGDTLQCRLVHTGNATLAPDEHCWHATLAPKPKSPCAIPTPNCDDYCRVVMAACTGDSAVYENEAECKATCAAFTPGQSDDQTENTLGCRTYHSYNALDIATSHCPHAGPGGDGHCGTDNCESYCALLQTACATDFAAAFASADACLTACEKVPGAAKESGATLKTAKSGGDSVSCRLLHLSRALAAPTDPSECQAAIAGTACD